MRMNESELLEGLKRVADSAELPRQTEESVFGAVLRVTESHLRISASQ